MTTETHPERVRAADLAATLCLATDVAMGFPFEHGLHSTLIAMRLADRLGADATVRRDTFDASLLSYGGCTADAETAARIFGGSLTTHVVPVMFGSAREGFAGIVRALPNPAAGRVTRTLQTARRLPRAGRDRRPHFAATCEVAATFAGRLDLPASVQDLLGLLTERWDGKSPLQRAEGDEIPQALRIVHVARDAATQRVLGGQERAAAVARDRAGHAFDPEVVACVTEDPGILDVDPTECAWSHALDGEPTPHVTLDRRQTDGALAAIGDFADLVSPHFTGHARHVAELATDAASQCGFDDDDVNIVRRAAPRPVLLGRADQRRSRRGGRRRRRTGPDAPAGLDRPGLTRNLCRRPAGPVRPGRRRRPPHHQPCFRAPQTSTGHQPASGPR